MPFQCLVKTILFLDIRSPEETDENPFESDEHQVMQLPFYKLSSQFGSLDQSKKLCALL